MAKVKLGARPKNFKRVVSFPMLEGGQGAIECLFKYRTREEFGEFVDLMVQSANVKPKSSDDAEAKFSMVDFMARTNGQNAEYVLAALDGWNVIDVEDKPVELTLDAVRQLANEIPGAAAAIMETYRGAISDGRTGN